MFDAILAAFPPLLADFAPMRPPPPLQTIDFAERAHNQISVDSPTLPAGL
jgi:hypothetical protein